MIQRSKWPRFARGRFHNKENWPMNGTYLFVLTLIRERLCAIKVNKFKCINSRCNLSGDTRAHATPMSAGTPFTIYILHKPDLAWARRGQPPTAARPEIGRQWDHSSKCSKITCVKNMRAGAHSAPGLRPRAPQNSRTISLGGKALAEIVPPSPVSSCWTRA